MDDPCHFYTSLLLLIGVGQIWAPLVKNPICQNRWFLLINNDFILLHSMQLDWVQVKYKLDFNNMV